MESLIMPFGKYKGQAVKGLPGYYLVHLYMSNPEQMERYPDVKKFILDNLKDQFPAVKLVTPLCHTLKICYVDEEEANKVLKLIRRDKRLHQKPNRSYLCGHCGYWHHTRKPKYEIRGNGGNGVDPGNGIENKGGF